MTGDEKVLKSLQVVGIQNIRFKMSVLKMNKLNRNISLLRRGEDTIYAHGSGRL